MINVVSPQKHIATIKHERGVTTITSEIHNDKLVQVMNLFKFFLKRASTQSNFLRTSNIEALKKLVFRTKEFTQ